MDGDAASILAILDWGEAHGRPIAHVKVGVSEVTFFEPAGDGKKREDRPGRRGIYAELGGKVWENAVRAGDIEGPGHGATNGEDLEPAVGTGA